MVRLIDKKNQYNALISKYNIETDKSLNKFDLIYGLTNNLSEFLGKFKTNAISTEDTLDNSILKRKLEEEKARIAKLKILIDRNNPLSASIETMDCSQDLIEKKIRLTKSRNQAILIYYYIKLHISLNSIKSGSISKYIIKELSSNIEKIAQFIKNVQPLNHLSTLIEEMRAISSELLQMDQTSFDLMTHPISDNHKDLSKILYEDIGHNEPKIKKALERMKKDSQDLHNSLVFGMVICIIYLICTSFGLFNEGNQASAHDSYR